MTDSFPRSPIIPSQSPIFWVTHKDRYLRQLLIKDIEAITNRDFFVYFTDTDNANAQIDPGDDQYFCELLKLRAHEGADLMLETPGGFTDATEKLCSVLRSMAPDLRVIVPRKAKSNGTVIALAAKEILMSSMSELGPIDPSIQNLPAEFILNDETANHYLKETARTALLQTKRLAKELLETGMMQGQTQEDIEKVVSKLASRETYHSHGSVIDAIEATALGLKIQNVPHTDELWQKIWLLRTMYAFDAPRNGFSKIFESSSVSTSVQLKT